MKREVRILTKGDVQERNMQIRNAAIDLFGGRRIREYGGFISLTPNGTNEIMRIDLSGGRIFARESHMEDAIDFAKHYNNTYSKDTRGLEVVQES